MASTPALTPAFIAEDGSGRLTAFTSAMLPVLIIFVALRFYARRLSRTAWGLDDYLVLVSLAFQIGQSALTYCFIKYAGVGRHFAAWEVMDPSKIETYFKYLLAVAFTYFFCVACPKLAILAFYARVFPLKSYRIIIKILAAIVTLTSVICPIVVLNLCHPFAYNWDRTIPGGHCVDEQTMYRWSSMPNIVTDIVMLILPLPVIWKLHTSFNVKTGLSVAFATGSLGLATSIVRFVYFYEGSAIEDGTWSSVYLMIWTMLEPDVYLIASCLVAYRPIFVHFFGTTSKVSTKLSSKVSSIGKGIGVQRASFRRPSGMMNESWLFHDTKVSVTASMAEKDGSFESLDRAEDLAPPGKIVVHKDYDVSVTAI